MLPANTAQILRFLGHVSQVDFIVSAHKSQVSLQWLGAELRTEQEILDAANDLTTINGQTFSQWLAENGGNATATLRRQTRDASSAPLPNAVLYRAAFLVMVDEFNRHTDKFTALRDAIANANNLADVKVAAAAIEPIPTRTGQDLRDAAIAKIDSGAADS